MDEDLLDEILEMIFDEVVSLNDPDTTAREILAELKKRKEDYEKDLTEEI